MKKGRQDRIAETLTIYLSNKGSPFTFSFSIINSWMKVKGDFFSMKWGKKRILHMKCRGFVIATGFKPVTG